MNSLLLDIWKDCFLSVNNSVHKTVIHFFEQLMCCSADFSFLVSILKVQKYGKVVIKRAEQRSPAVTSKQTTRVIIVIYMCIITVCVYRYCLTTNSVDEGKMKKNPNVAISMRRK